MVTNYYISQGLASAIKLHRVDPLLQNWLFRNFLSKLTDLFLVSVGPSHPTCEQKSTLRTPGGQSSKVWKDFGPESYFSSLFAQSHSSRAVKSMWRTHPKLPSNGPKKGWGCQHEASPPTDTTLELGTTVCPEHLVKCKYLLLQKQRKQTASNSEGRGSLPNIFHS